MTESPGTVIVGAGQAGGELAFTLRSKGSTSPVTLVGREPYLPYQRPPLSKGFLLSTASADSLLIRPESVYDKLDITRLLDTEVTHIDRAAKTVTLSDGRQLDYDTLVLATGGTARRFMLPGASKSNVYYLRAIADVERLRAAFEKTGNLVIVGGGYIGLEIAAAARVRGIATSLVEEAPRHLARTAAPEVAAFFETEHRSRGVNLHTGVRVDALHGNDVVEEVELSNGERLPCNAVIFGIGLVPETTLASNAGLVVHDGIRVDRYLRTSDPDILAVGDCAEAEHAFYGRHVRLESVPNALEQARVAAATIRGETVENGAVPWFWSDQYDIKLQIAGLSSGYDRLVVRGVMSERSFQAFYLLGGEVVSVDSVNRPTDFMVAKRLVKQRAKMDAQKLADEATPLKSFLPVS
jgi:3-phenylpropionate/trans-cinnamate dioxygenase ferredoxin reductase subunit